MTTLFDVLRMECGFAGEEAADLIESLERKVSMLEDENEAMARALKLIASAKDDGFSILYASILAKEIVEKIKGGES